MRNQAFLILSFFIFLLPVLVGCTPRFPTDKFIRPEGSVNRFLIFYPDGRWESFLDGNLASYGEYQTDGELITFESDSECETAGIAEPGVYHWDLSDNSLQFESQAPDACAERSLRLNGDAYQKSP